MKVQQPKEKFTSLKTLILQLQLTLELSQLQEILSVYSELLLFFAEYTFLFETSPTGTSLSKSTSTPSGTSFSTQDPARDGIGWYVYCENSPVVHIDPDGRKYVKPDARKGQKAHAFFEDSLTAILVVKENAKDRTAYSDRPLNRILNFIFEQVGIHTKNREILIGQDPAVDELSSPKRRPDLTVVDYKTNTIKVYELKPDSCKTGEKNKKAEKQITTYITELSKNSSGFVVEGGNDILDGLVLPYLEVGPKGTITFTKDLEIQGLYYYTIDDGE